ncbi:phosphoesterase [Kaistella flava (ex Peng et al. 2021)]|uniref:Phosphoesterase n=1 Tax=Kaistella flava (ex Peng et al. 2021) TaxID=2038776 RepID=A0A7M2YA13_9FLAO|nr:metallophosphoesterase [Kaistella flava (ex Peng et al. 2021)]QOW10262.1 phosphoesterase [Kaistella flava (ex Peng et al. 2021)]
MIDFIGDIHGHADKLEELLLKLGYSKPNSFYLHSNPNRKVLFVGDYIDRGPKIRETLEIVKSMVDNGSAIALMGNHEYNALCFHFQETDGGHLRKHLIKNIIQHYETLKQFQNRQEEYEGYLEWFKTLPLFYESENFRAVHACWDDKIINFLKTKLVENRLNDELIYESVKKGTPLNEAIEETLKGKEIKMPEGLFFNDKDGTVRTEIRIKWWENPAEMTYKEISVEPLRNLPETKIDLNFFKNSEYYKEDEKPVFFGHYWLRGKPLLKRENICCLDYSVAKQGYLVAYSFNGELTLLSNKLTFVENLE